MSDVDVGPESLGLLTVFEVAKLLKLSVKTIRRRIDAERKYPGTGLESVKDGTAVRVEPEAVIAYKKQLKKASQPGAPSRDAGSREGAA